MTGSALRRENRAFKGTGGISQENRCGGFVPAFLDARTGTAYRSCFADGHPAPIHVLEGLPAHLLTVIRETGEIAAASPGIVSGFLCAGRFYTREEAAAAMRQCAGH